MTMRAMVLHEQAPIETAPLRPCLSSCASCSHGSSVVIILEIHSENGCCGTPEFGEYTA